MAEFTEVGSHCAMPGCNQQDFLPFVCDCCSGTFCLSHRAYREHSCPSADNKDFRAVVCPLCKKTIRFLGNQDPNEQWALHSRTDCNPQQRTTNKRKRCKFAGCKEILGPTNTHRCPRCGHDVCLKHRFPDSHDCAAVRADNRKDAERAAVARLAQKGRPMSLREKALQRTRANAANAANAAPENTARGAAERRRREWEARTGRRGSAGGGGGGGGGVGGERCPQCGDRFGDVQALVAHVEARHSQERAHPPARSGGAARAGAAGQGGGETCPICSIWVADAALLVSHVQVEHPEYASASGGGISGMISDGAKSCCVS